MPKSNLVIITCGSNSLHQFWEKNHKTDSNFDLALLIYDNSTYNDINSKEAKFIQVEQGIKFKLFNTFLKTNPQILDEYEYFLLFDDDLLCTIDDLSEFFDIIKKHNFDLAQPSLTQDSYYSHIPTLNHNNSYYRLTNYVEIMCPAFSRRFLKDIKSIFDEIEVGVGYGLEQYWYEVLDNYKGISKYLGKVGIIDKIAVKHTKPPGSGNFYGKVDINKEASYIISKCNPNKHIWNGDPIISYENGFKTIQTYCNEDDKILIYDTLSNKELKNNNYNHYKLGQQIMKIKIFVRHCNFSANSATKNRPEWFSRELCWKNLKNTIDNNTEITVLFDGEPNKDHFLNNDKEGYNLVCMPAGNDAKSFLNLLEYIQTLSFDDTDIIYFLEDDFIHKPNWCNILREGFDYIDTDYITLYDHNDKYFYSMYQDLTSKILCTPSTHWKSIPNTTNTYASLAPTLLKDIDIHLQYCDLIGKCTRDFDKFNHLEKIGRTLINPIPGYSTHCEPEFLSPLVDWEKIVQQTTK
jgi:hypothetical protein